MNENINLCEILKGHEGETFYMYGQGDCTLMSVEDIEIEGYPIKVKAKFYHENGYDICEYSLKADGTIETNDLMLFPSKEQRDWNKWVEEQNSKVPKTWDELCKQTNCKDVLSVTMCYDDQDCSFTENNTLIEKSALALLKIHQLIEVGYGGNVSNEEFNSSILYYIYYSIRENRFYIASTTVSKEAIMFHTKEQAEEFLSKPENVQLLKDYFMI